MRFGVLGATQVWRADGSEAPLGGRGRRALLTLLLVRPGEVVSVDSLVEDLYGSTAGAAHSLQSQVFRLRTALGGAVEHVQTGYRLRVAPDDVDASRFERLSAEGRLALAGGDAEHAAELLRAALALWRGPAFADVADCAGAQARAAELERLHLATIEDRAEADLQLGAHRAVVPELARLVEQHPVRERLRALLMRALRADGRPAEALLVFADIRGLLADELGTDPSADLVELHQELLRGDEPARVRRPPAQLTGFVGRTAELAQVAALLRTARLVTLVGPGGVGKTRLSIEVAARRPDVCFVELAPVRNPAELPGAVLAALGLRETALHPHGGQTPPEARLAEALADRSLLLVLDNCEHLVDAVATLVARLVAACAALRVLATSREPLKIIGEHLWPVRPLDEAPAVRLFVDRATAVRPGLAPDLDISRQICATLDGLPLAIELAAARLRTTDLPRLAAGLRDRFAMLSRGSPAAEPRHRTLRAAVAWSWELLSPLEQVVASRLSVFAGSADLTGAQRVCAVAGLADVLDSLTDKSLLVFDDGRYRMLETIRSYCAEQLADEPDVRRVHAEHLVELAGTADPFLRRAEQLRWLEILDAERENLYAALHWAVDTGETALSLRLIGAWSPYLWLRGLRASVMTPAAAVLDRLGDRPPPGLADEYVFCVLAAGRRQPAAEAVALAPGRERHPMILFLWGMTYPGESNKEPITSARQSAQPWEAATAHLMSGYPEPGGHETAEREFRAAADGFRALGDRWGLALALGSLAGLANLRGDLAGAVVLVEEALTFAEQLGATEDVCDLLCDRADYRVRLGDLTTAHDDYSRAERVARHAGLPTYQGAGLRGLGDLARLAGDLDAAGRYYEQALATFDTHWFRSAGNRAGALLGLGQVAEVTGDLAGGRARYLQALEVTVATGTLPDGARALDALAGVTLAEGDPASAARLLGAATALRGSRLPSEFEPSARAALGDTAFETAYAHGATLSPTDALRLAGVLP